MNCPIAESQSDHTNNTFVASPNTFFVGMNTDTANFIPVSAGADADALKLEVNNLTNYSCNDCYEMAMQLIKHQMNYHRTYDTDKRQNVFDILINVDESLTSFANGNVDCEIVIEISRPSGVPYDLDPVKLEPFEPTHQEQYDEDHRSDFDSSDHKFRNFLKVESETVSPLQRHKKRHRKKLPSLSHQWKCTICNRKYKNELNLQTHYKKYHTGPTAKPPSAFKKKRKPTPMFCDYCGKLLMSKCKMQNHFVDEHRFTISYTCRTCSATFPNSLLLVRHRHSVHSDKPYRCQYGCNARFSYPESLSRHNATVHGQYDTLYICDLCGEKFPHRYIILKHFRNYHLQTRKPDARIHCKLCDREFSRRSTLNQHMNNHSGAKPFRCQYGCDQSFSTKPGMAQHHSRYHDAPKYQCEVCSKMFYSPGQLKMHQTKHSGERPFACELCSKTFAMKACLKSHLMVHRNERRYRCELCNSSFYSSCHLQRHKRRRTPCNAKPDNIVCGICNESFAQKSLFNQHVREHRKDERIKCDRCDMAFFTESHLRRHQAKKKPCKKGQLEIGATHN